MSLLTNTMALDFKLSDACLPDKLSSRSSGQVALLDPFWVAQVAPKPNLRVAVIGPPVQYQDSGLNASLVSYHDFCKTYTGPELEKMGTRLVKKSRQRIARLSHKTEDQIHLVVARVVNQDGLATTANVVKALHWAFDQRVDVICCHLEGSLQSFWLGSILKRIDQKKVLLLVPNQGPQVPVTKTPIKTKKPASNGPSIIHVGEMWEGLLAVP